MQNKNNQDFLTMISKILEFGFLLSEEKEYKELLKNIFGVCDIENLTIIISMFCKYNDNIIVIELFLESIYLRNSQLRIKSEEMINKLKKDNSKKKKKVTASQKERFLNADIQYQKEMKNQFTEQCLRLLFKINNNSSIEHYAQALILRLVLDDGNFNSNQYEEDKNNRLYLNESTERTQSMPNDYVVINSLLMKFTPSEPLMKCLLLDYCDYDKEKQVEIMKDKDKFEKIEYERFFNKPFTFQKKTFLVNIINYMCWIIKTNEALFLSTARIFNDILLQLIKTIEVDAKRTKENMCWFHHIFESYQICGTFFISYILKIGFLPLNEYLKSMTKSLINLHPNPFIYLLYEKLIKSNREESMRLLNHFDFKAIKIESNNQHIIEKNLQEYCLMLKALSECNIIPNETFEEVIKSFIQLLNETQIIYSNKLIACSKEKKMTMIEIMIEMCNTITKDDFTLMKDILIEKESKWTILYEFDKRNDSQLKIKEKDNPIEREDSSIVIKILDKYCNDKRWIENKVIIGILQLEREEISQKMNKLVLTSKNKKIAPETNSSKSNDINNKEFDNSENSKVNNENESFSKSSNCTIDENDTCDISKTNQIDIQIKPENSDIAEQLIKHEYNSNLFLGFYDVGINNAVICCKRDLILRAFAIYFLDVYFEDEQFKLVYNNYYQYTERIKKGITKTKNKKSALKKDEYNNKKPDPILLPIPTKLRNCSSCTHFTPRIFLKKDFDFYHSDFFNITHPYYTSFTSKRNIKTYNNLITDIDNPVKSKFFNLTISIFECKAELIKANYITCGTLYLLSNNLLFISSKSNKEYIEDRKTYEYAYSNSVTDIQQRNKEVIILLNKIEEVIVRRFLYKYIAIEVFMRNGKSYFFNLHKASVVKKEKAEDKNGLLDHLNELKARFNKFRVITNPKQEVKIKDIVALWKKNKLSNFELILLLNKYSGRSYNDLNQYPIVPWVYLFTTNKEVMSKPVVSEDRMKEFLEQNKDESAVASFISIKSLTEPQIKIDLNKPVSLYERLKKHLRDFQYPISVQTIENQKRVEKKYKDCLKVESKKSHIPQFRLFYSNSAYIIFYLFRLNPFTQIQILFQSGKFETPGRQFNSVPGLVTLLYNNLDNRELVPELFSSFEYSLNLNYCYYGIRPATNDIIHNIERPNEINSLAQLPYLQLRLLNTDQIKEKINDWIDNIFGYYQLKPNSTNRMNTFDKYTYAQLIDVDAKKSKYLQKETTKEMQPNSGVDKLRTKADRIIAFGQTPEKLFIDLFKKWEVYDGKENTDDDFSKVGNLMGNLNVVWKDNINKESRVIYCNLTSHHEFIYTLIIEPKDYNTIKIFRNKNEFSKPDQIYIAKMKLFKIQIDKTDNNKNYILRYPAKYSIFDTMNGTYFFTCRHFDNSIKIYSKNGLVSSYITDSFVSTIYRLDNIGFFSGSRNGKLIHWLIRYKNNSIIGLTQKRSVYAHNGMITGILYVKQHHILITIGEDRNLFIRKMDSLELMTKISTNSDTDYFVDFAFSFYNQIWTLTLDSSKISQDKKSLFLSGYSINGICFYNSDFNTYNGICVNSNGVVITSLFESSSIYLYSLEWFHKSSNSFPYLNLDPHEINLKNGFDFNVGNEFLFSNFTYFNESNTFYIIFGNKVFRIAYDNQTSEHEWFNDKEIKANISLSKFNMGY